MSVTTSLFILFLFFFVLPALLYTIAYARYAHDVLADQKRMFLGLLGRVALAVMIILTLRVTLLLGLYAVCTGENALEAVVRTLWTALPELIWLVYRVDAMVQELQLTSGSYRDRVVSAYLKRYTSWIVRCYSMIAAAVVLSMVVVAVALWGQFDGIDLEREPVRWTVGVGLGVGTLLTVLLTKLTEPMMPTSDPTAEASQPLPRSEDSAVAGREDVDAAIRDWKARR